MKIFLKVLLTILFIPIFLIFIILISLKFQFLNSDFWLNTFEKNGVYQSLENVVPKIIDYQSKNDDEIKLDKKITTQLLTRGNLKEFIETNIKNTLSYANGKSENWMIFIPSKKLPKGLLPNFMLEKEEIPANTLQSFFSRGQENKSPFIFQVGLAAKYALMAVVFWTLLVFLILFILYKIKGIFAGLFTAGLFTLLLAVAVKIAKITFEKELVQNGREPSQWLLGILAPPIAQEIANLWMYIALGAIISAFAMKIFLKSKN